MSISGDDFPRLPKTVAVTRPGMWMALGLAGTMLLLGASAIFALHAASVVASHGEERSRHNAIGNHIHVAYSTIKDVETARRGFVLMNDERYLAPYHSSHTTIENAFANLKTLLVNDTERLRMVNALEESIMARMALAQASIELMREEGEHSERQRSISPEGKAAMERVRLLAETLLDEHAEELERLSVLEARKKQHSTIAIVVAQVLSIVLISIVFFFLFRELRQRAVLQRKITEAYTEVSRSVARLRERSKQISKLGEMSDLLHVCHTSEEAYHIVGEYVPRLFSARAGAICLTAASRDHVVTHTSWGDLQGHDDSFSPNACWALRRGILHRYSKNVGEIHCEHLTGDLPGGTICYPLVAQGETLGFVHLQYDHLPDEQGDEIRLLRTFVEQMGLALANLSLREALKIQATRDALSGLFNRRYMQEALELEFRRAERDETSRVGIILMDLDHFKSFNDTQGHAAGDTVIREVGRFLAESIRSGDIACRYGGEEFVLILPGADTEQTARRAKNICDGVQALNILHEGLAVGKVTFSLGVAVYPIHGQDTATVMAAADDALYSAKKKGRNQVVLAEVDVQAAD